MKSGRSVLALSLAACACTGPTASSRPPDKPAMAQTEAATSTAPKASSRPLNAEPLAPACTPLPPGSRLASLPLPGDRTLHIVGDPVRTIESDEKHEIIDARLLLARGSCLLSQAPVGELSRAADPEVRQEIGEIRPIGGHKENRFAVEHGRVGKNEVLLVFVPLEVQWGLCEYHVVPFTMNGGALVAGDRVQSGRDAMGGEVYYGEAKIDGSDLLILRHGVRGMLPPIRLRVDRDAVIRGSAPQP